MRGDVSVKVIHFHFLTTEALTFIGTLSPLLTLTALWQVKEWRIDRMKECIRSEGFIRLWGSMRPAFAGIALCLMWALRTSINEVSLALALMFAALSLAQLLFKRQRMPKWTQKAKLIFVLGLIINAILIRMLDITGTSAIVPFIVLFQPFVLAASWLMTLPIDICLKRKIFKRAASLRESHPNVIAIGVTGSVGKTTVKELLNHILAERSVATPAHVNTEMGVSQWLINTLRSAVVPEVLIVEMGAYREGEISLMCSVAKPSLSIVTYVGNQHIALFGSQEKLQRAKGEIVRSLPEDGHAFLNADSVLCAQLKETAPCPVTLVGTGGSNDLEAFDIEETSSGIRFTCLNTVFDLPLHGTHNVTNALLSIAVARHLKMETNVIAQRMRTFVPPEQTFTVNVINGKTVLDDTHNASYSSFKAAVTWAKSQPHETKVLLTCGLIELGTEEEKAHIELGGLCNAVFDRVIFTDKRRMKMFAKGYDKPVEFLEPDTGKIPEASLLVCEGRVAEKSYRQLV